MIQLRLLIIIAVVANVLTVACYQYASSQPGGTGAAMVFALVWMPLIWLPAIILAAIVAIKGQKKIFAGSKRTLAIAILLFCTPVPFFLILQITTPSPETARSSSTYSRKNGKVFKTERWYYTDNYTQTYVEMYYSADSIDEAREGEFALKKDSSWTYFTIKGDTLKVEQYQSGELISTREYNK